MTGLGRRWPFCGRRDELADVRAALSGHRGRGVVLVGPAGVGKTTLAHQALDQLTGSFEKVYLRGSTALAGVPLGALNVLLAGHDEEIARNPLLVLGALQRQFDGAGSGRRTLVHVDGVEEIDELSAAVIAHLARVDAVRVIITCRVLSRAPTAFLDLWKDDLLERFDLEALTLEATTEMLRAVLEAPVSRSAARYLWRASGGNPRYLQSVTRAGASSGRLIARDGVWVVQQARPRPPVPPADDQVLAELGALPPEDRAVVEVLTVVGRLPVGVLLRVVEPASLDHLQSAGVLTPDVGDVPLLGLGHEAFADAVRDRFISTAGMLALEALNPLRDEPGMPPRARAALAAWTLARGEVPKDPELVSLAHLAHDEGLDDLAGVFLDALLPGRDTGRAAIERARRSWSAGRITEALAVLEPLLTPEPAASPALREWIDARLLATRLRSRTPGGRSQAAALLDDVDEALRRADVTDEDLMDETASARLELQLFDGDLDQVCGRAPELLTRVRTDARFRPRIDSVLGAARAGLGVQEHALRRAEEVLVGLADIPTGPDDRGIVSAHVTSALFLAGFWGECLDLLRAWSDSPGTASLPGSPLECAEGILLAYLGRSSEALARLGPAVSQFRVSDRFGLLPLAEAAAAYASVLEGHPGEAEEHLRGVDLTGRRSSWYLGEAVLYFRLLTEAWLDTADVVSRELLDHARLLGDTGHRGLELIFLCQAVQLGCHEAADALAASASACQGPFARLAEDLAKGLSSHDPCALGHVALKALERGNNNLAGDCAGLSIDHLTESDDPMILVHAEKILRRTATPARRHIRQKLLSERERAIARKVASGVPNKEIAQQEHLSPRTVEGHVHRIMSKLGLSSRKQLALIFGRQE